MSKCSRIQRGLASILPAAILMLSACVAAPEPARAAKARRTVSVWYEYKGGRTFDELAPYADILTSVSVCGEMPPRAFVEACQAKQIKVFRLVSGDGTAFDTPAHRRATLDGYLRMCRELNLDGIDLDFENLPAELRAPYAEFVKLVGDALHKLGKALSICVFPPLYGPPASPSFWDAAVIAAVCDQVRVMCYDLHMAPGLYGSWWPLASHPGFGPTSTAPWGKAAMSYWLEHVPRAKLIMALPAYGNDYDTAPGGRGTQIYAPAPPIPEGAANEKFWLSYEQVHVYRYLDAEKRPHVFFASDTRSTEAHLRTIDELNLPGVCFWHFHPVPPETWTAVREWLSRSVPEQ